MIGYVKQPHENARLYRIPAVYVKPNFTKSEYMNQSRQNVLACDKRSLDKI